MFATLTAGLSEVLAADTDALSDAELSDALVVLHEVRRACRRRKPA